MLMLQEAVDDPDKWGKIPLLLFDHPDKIEAAYSLIVSMVCAIAAGWQMRIMDPASDFPLRFLLCVQAL